MIRKTCGYCRKTVRLHKPIFGSLHVCVTDEQERKIDLAHHMARAQMSALRRSTPDDHCC